MTDEFAAPGGNRREWKRLYMRDYRLGLRRTNGKRSVLLRVMARLHHELNVEALGECWVWLGALNSNGYGVIRGDDGTLVLVHRVALAAALRRPIETGMHACHKCDIRHCARPAHLYEGTPEENAADKDGHWAMNPPRYGAEVAA